MTERLRELLAALTEGCEPGPWHGVSGPRHNWWLENEAGDSSFPSPDDVALMVNALPELLDAHDRMAGALRGVIDVLEGEAPLLDHYRREAIRAARAALAVPKEETP